jgi:hypothetical protein
VGRLTRTSCAEDSLVPVFQLVSLETFTSPSDGRLDRKLLTHQSSGSSSSIITDAAVAFFSGSDIEDFVLECRSQHSQQRFGWASVDHTAAQVAIERSNNSKMAVGSKMNVLVYSGAINHNRV